MTRTLPLALSSCAIALFASGCGGGDSKDTGTAPAAPAQTQGDAPSSAEATTVTMKDIAYAPKDITVKKGTLIRWVNEDSVEHNVVAEEGATFKSDLFEKGGTYETKVGNTGKISYVCTIHPGMTGTITVE